MFVQMALPDTPEMAGSATSSTAVSEGQSL
jgi:hypothetical protein